MLDAFEQQYYDATKKYLEMLDTMIEVASEDPEASDLEKTSLKIHRDFTQAVLDSF